MIDSDPTTRHLPPIAAWLNHGSLCTSEPDSSSHAEIHPPVTIFVTSTYPPLPFTSHLARYPRSALPLSAKLYHQPALPLPRALHHPPAQSDTRHAALFHSEPPSSSNRHPPSPTHHLPKHSPSPTHISDLSPPQPSLSPLDRAFPLHPPPQVPDTRSTNRPRSHQYQSSQNHERTDNQPIASVLQSPHSHPRQLDTNSRPSACVALRPISYWTIEGSRGSCGGVCGMAPLSADQHVSLYPPGHPIDGSPPTLIRSSSRIPFHIEHASVSAVLSRFPNK